MLFIRPLSFFIDPVQNVLDFHVLCAYKFFLKCRDIGYIVPAIITASGPGLARFKPRPPIS
jgi:hypothetical protein